MSQATNRSMVMIGIGAILCVAMVARAQYNTFDSDSNSDSDGNPILTQAELGKLVRNSARFQASQNNQHRHNQHAAASRNLYNRNQPMQYAPTHHRRDYGASEGLAGYSPLMGASQGRGARGEANNDDDDDQSNSFGPSFGANFDAGHDAADNDGETGGASNADAPVMNLKQAASGYPNQADYGNSNEAAGAGFGFEGQSGYGPSMDGSEFGPSDGYGGEGRRAKSASSQLGSRHQFGVEDDAGATHYGPNSAINAGDRDIDDDGRAGYAPEGHSEGNDDDE